MVVIVSIFYCLTILTVVLSWMNREHEAMGGLVLLASCLVPIHQEHINDWLSISCLILIGIWWFLFIKWITDIFREAKQS